EPPRYLRLDGSPLSPMVQEPAWDPRVVSAAATLPEQLSTVVVRRIPYRIATVALGPPDRPHGVAQIAHPLLEQSELLAGLSRTLWTLIPLALLVAGLGGAFLAEQALRPVRALTRAAAEITEADLSRRLEVPGPDELGRLASTFNGMVARLEGAFDRLERAYRQQQRFAGDASHELRTPLTALKANTSLALMGPGSVEEYREALVAADQAADTMTRIVQDLLLLARSDAGRLRLVLAECRVPEVVDRVLLALPRERAAAVILELGADLPAVRGDLHHLQRLFGNLLENAVRHTPVGGAIRVLAWLGDPGRPPADSRGAGIWPRVQPTGPGATPASSPGGRNPVSTARVCIAVEDAGEGIPPEHLPHLCERFYRVDQARTHDGHPTGGGTGLGLAICLTIAEAHAAELYVESAPGEGTRVTVALPTADAVSAPESSENAWLRS
ncbi:MAG: HAMP domain-containing protein, partial [Armatimonadetes bacterium]|nr:HAMP domain-containing protein [Armatimonadota bacterium]